MENVYLNLQLFAEGDGGDGGATSTGESAETLSGAKKEIPAFIPEKAKKFYEKAMNKTSAETVDQPPQEETTTKKPSYKDLIKSEEYKEEHKAYMEQTINERLKKYKGLEDGFSKAKATLEIVANKYGVDPNSEDFLEVLNSKIEADDSYYENYAMEHDITTDEARRIVTMERKVAQIEAQKAEQEKQEKMRQQIMLLQQNAEQTKARFPNFNLEAEMQNEKFRRLCAVNNGDTTAAYMACHWGEILPATVQIASQKVQEQTAKAVASNKARPIENGMSSSAPSVVVENFKGMSLKEIRAYAEEQRRKGR